MGVLCPIDQCMYLRPVMANECAMPHRPMCICVVSYSVLCPIDQCMYLRPMMTSGCVCLCPMMTSGCVCCVSYCITFCKICVTKSNVIYDWCTMYET